MGYQLDIILTGIKPGETQVFLEESIRAPVSFRLLHLLFGRTRQ